MQGIQSKHSIICLSGEYRHASYCLVEYSHVQSSFEESHGGKSSLGEVSASAMQVRNAQLEKEARELRDENAHLQGTVEEQAHAAVSNEKVCSLMPQVLSK